jgi:hypothetical protein
MTPIFKTALLSLAPPRRTLRPAPPLSRTRLPLWRPQPRTRRSGAIQSREVEGGVEDWSWQGSNFFLHVRSSGRHGRARCCWKWAAQLSTGVRWQRRHQYPVSEYREQWRRMQEIQCMAGTAETVAYSSEQ